MVELLHIRRFAERYVAEHMKNNVHKARQFLRGQRDTRGIPWEGWDRGAKVEGLERSIAAVIRETFPALADEKLTHFYGVDLEESEFDYNGKGAWRVDIGYYTRNLSQWEATPLRRLITYTFGEHETGEHYVREEIMLPLILRHDPDDGMLCDWKPDTSKFDAAGLMQAAYDIAEEDMQAAAEAASEARYGG